MLENYRDLVTAVLGHDCMIFLGAGTSKDAGLPDSGELASELAKVLVGRLRQSNRNDEADTVESHGRDLTSVAESFHNIYGNGKVKDAIAEIISQRQKTADPEPFDSIAGLPRNLYVTTNFDTLLEQKFTTDDRTVVWKADHLKKVKADRSTIVKLHGTVDDPSSLVVLRDDFANYPENEDTGGIYRWVVGELPVKTLLVVGSSLSDSDFLTAVAQAKPGKDVFIVDPAAAPITFGAWQRKGATTIKMGAKEFFQELTSAVEELARLRPKPEMANVPKGAPSPRDRNPFKYYTTDGLSSTEFLELYRLFVPPDYSEFAKVYNPDKHHFVQGSRGCGKTVILRGMAIETLLKASVDTPYVGFWLPLSDQYVGTVRREAEPDQVWFRFFASYLTLLIAEQIAQSLNFCAGANLISIDPSSEAKFTAGVAGDLSLNQIPATFEDLCDSLYRLRHAHEIAANPTARASAAVVSSTFLHQITRRLGRLAPYFKEKHIFILLDDAHFMEAEQKRAFVAFLTTRRGPLSFKVGTKDDFGVHEDMFGSVISERKDYETIYLDRWSGREGRKAYREFIREIASRRLQSFGQGITPEDLLPKGQRPAKGRVYSGFAEYVVLSSGVVRDFVTLVKDTIYYANPEVAFEDVTLKPIPPNIQNEVISLKSAILLKEAGYGGDLGPELRLLIDTLATLFIQTLQASKSRKQIRTVSGIEIKDESNLKPRVEAVLEKGLELQLFQRPLLSRLPQTPTHPSTGLKFHRLLLPYYRLELSYRWPRRVSATQLNGLFLDPEGFVKALMASLPSEVEESEEAKYEIDYTLDDLGEL